MIYIHNIHIQYIIYTVYTVYNIHQFINNNNQINVCYKNS